MIALKDKPDSSEDIKELLHPFVREWFFKKFKDFSLPQLYGVMEVHSRNNILISAPTGSGKTISSFLAILNELIDSSEKGILQDKVYCIYISPLRALSRDIHKNLIEPLKEIEEIANKKFGIRISVRTGDTTAAEKAKMLAKPPHIIITTPESLAILLNSIKFRNYIKNVDWTIVDEIHSLGENKRGVHLSLSLERLQYLSPGMCRVGLSATISPLEEIARFLVGDNRKCKIVDARFNKNLDLKVISPVDDLINSSYEQTSNETYKLIDKLIHEHKTTLIFTNTRSGTERVVHHLKSKFPKKYTEITEDDPTGYSSLIGAHHGSLSKEHRFKMEDALRKGRLKCIVSSTSLELGLDIGYIDLVICLGSPKSIARLLQRCLPYNSRILLADGSYLPIGEIVENKLNVEVLSYDKNKGFVNNKIINYHKNKTSKLLKINLHSGLSLECTEEHPVFTKKGWIKANELKIHDEVAEIFDFDINTTPYIYEMINKKEFYVENKNNFLRNVVDNYVKNNKIKYSKQKKKVGITQNHLQNYIRKNGRRKSIRLDVFLNIMQISGIKQQQYLSYLTELKTQGHHRTSIPLKPTQELMWLAGMVASDGSITKHKRYKYYKIKMGNKDIKLLEECQKIFEKFGFKSRILKTKNKDFYSIDCGSKLLTYILISLGIKVGKEKSYNIEVSNILNNMPKNLIIPYIEGILEGDGNKNNNIRIFSASRKFVVGLHNLLNRSGINNYFFQKEAKISKLVPKINTDKSYCLYISRNSYVKQFLKYCIFRGKKAKYLRDKTYHHSLKDKDIQGNINWVKVTDIKNKVCDAFVYNITLQNEPNSYFVESILTHNCGRAGHQLHSTVKGRVIASDRDDLVECCVMVKDAIERKIDRIHIPTNCLDVLAQQIDGMALEQVWDINELYNLIKKSHCYKDLEYKDFMEILDYLSGEFASLEDRYVYAKIWKNDGKIGKKGKLGRVIYMTNIGTIPDESFVIVKVGEQVIGHIDENFLERLKPGDIFVLGGNTYEFRFAKGMVAQVKSAEGRQPTIPSWFSEMLPLSFDLALDIQKFRWLMDDKFENKRNKKEILDFVNNYLYVDENATEAIYNYFYDQYKYLEIPNHKKIIVEHFIDEHNKYYIIFHSLYGRRVNDVLSRALAFAIGRNQHRDVEVGINDNGFYVSCPQRINALLAFKLLKSEQLRDVLKLALDKSEVLKRRFRHCAARAFMILRNYKGQTKRVGRQQVSSMLLLSAVRKISDDFCILKEARREVLEDLMDINNTVEILKLIEEEKIKVVEFNTRLPSPFSFNLILESYSDILKMEDRHEFLKRMHDQVRAKISLQK
ncbi:DEAD/DEAH box helicase [Candidatus Woesearchaeota archaeon]|nr:DEAD/DEAH box helicase [Candidatus Woesearchaeota archaeon]